jgi:hypothetical protein
MNIKYIAGGFFLVATISHAHTVNDEMHLASAFCAGVMGLSIAVMTLNWK